MTHLPFAVGVVLSVSTLAAAAQESATPPGLAELRRSLPYRPQLDQAALGDWDGDGDLDMVTAGPGVFALSTPVVPPLAAVFTNDGEANLERTDATAGPFDPRPTALALGDMDGDGDLDAVVAGYSQLWLLANNGQAGFDESFVTPVPATFVFDMASVDLEQDGALDVVLGTSVGLFVSRNLGNGSFDFPQILGGIVQRVERVVAADLNRDGAPDLVLETETLINDGTGGFTPGAQTNLRNFDAGDVDGDGWVDLISRTGLLLNDRMGGFVDASGNLPVYDPFVEPFPGQALLADIDGDLDLDLATEFGLLLNDGTGIFQTRANAYPAFDYSRVTNLEGGDLDGDGDTDLVLGGPQRILLGDGSGSFADTSPQAPVVGSLFGGTGPVAVADFDGDGSLDVTDGAALYRNDGRGVLEADESALPANYQGSYPFAGDLDGDGDTDVLLASSGRLLENDGSGTFSQGASCGPIPSGTSRDAALGDFDGDGDLDVFLAQVRASTGGYDTVSFDAALDALWSNDGSGCFLDVTTPALPPINGLSFGVDHGDLDGDGDLDLVTSAGDVYRNTGAGLFESGGDHVPGAGQDVALGDLDGDGDLDAYFGGSLIAWNDGQGRFTETLPTGEQIPPGLRVELADLDGDGKLDVALGIFRRFGCCLGFESRSLFFRRAASGAFEPLAAPETISPYPALGDFDRDGDADVFAGGRVFFNLTRQLARGSYPRVGCTLKLELNGPAFSRWALFASLSLVPASPQERLRGRLVGPIVFRRFGAFDTSRASVVDLDVPADPALVGLTAYWQALMGPPLAWTGYEVTELTGF